MRARDDLVEEIGGAVAGWPLVWFLLYPQWRTAAINLGSALVHLRVRDAAGGPWPGACPTGVNMPQADRHRASRSARVSEPSGMLDALEPLSVRGLSPDGLLVECPNPLDVGSIHEFQLSDGTTSVRVRAAVRHVSPQRHPSADCYFLVDLAFLDLDARSSVILERWLERQPGQRPKKGG